MWRPTGEVRIVDYKTGKAPRPEYAEGALFQMKFYALVVWRLKNVVPRRLQLVYLGSGDVLTYDPVLADLERVERKLLALWEAIRQATETGEWRPRPTKLCGWCDHQAVCPEFGGTPPVYPLPVSGPPSRWQGGQGRMGPVGPRLDRPQVEGLAGDLRGHPRPAGRRPAAAAHRLPDDSGGRAGSRGRRRGRRRPPGARPGAGAAARCGSDGHPYAADGRRRGDPADHRARAGTARRRCWC